MTCRRICRELLWLTRFGEPGPSSAPHVEHLAGCRGCWDEVGFDRAMLQQLQVALEARIANASPPASAWDRILARAQSPEPRRAGGIWRRWSGGILARQRIATAMAGTGLALVLALNMEVVPVGLPMLEIDATSDRITLEQVPWLEETGSSATEFIGVSDAGSGNTQLAEPAALILAARPQPRAQPTVQVPAQDEEATIPASCSDRRRLISAQAISPRSSRRLRPWRRPPARLVSLPEQPADVRN